MKLSEFLINTILIIAASVSVIAVAVMCFFLLESGLPAIREIGLRDFITGARWRPAENKYGILPMILGSVFTTTAAVSIALPISIFTAVFISRFCPERISCILKSAISILAAIPSVIYGFFGLTAVAPIVRELFGGDGSSLLTASLILSVMILPTVTAASQAAISSVEESCYHGAVALGADEVQSVFKILLPAAQKGIFSAVSLGIGRAIGETTAVMMVSGNQVSMPQGLLKGVRTLTANIALEIGYAADLHRGALAATAILLFIAVFTINFAAMIVGGRKSEKSKT